MPVKPKRKSYSAARTLKELEGDIAFQETIYCQMTDLLAETDKQNKQKTVAVHDNRTPVPVNSLELVEDPDGAAVGSPGSTLITRGHAFIAGADKEKKIAAFRKSTSSGGGGD